jgi:hypothetical protein
MSDRTYAQRLQDDEDHRLAICGDLEADRGDLRVRFEVEDFEQGKYDSIFAPGHPQAHPPQARSGADGSGRETAGRAVGPGPYFYERGIR